MRKISLTVRFLIYTFLIAVVINTIVITAHILTAGEFDSINSLKIILLSLGVSIAFFAFICILLFIVSIIFSKKGKESRYWIIMLVAVIVTALMFIEFDNLFAAYSSDPAMIAAISAFSILVSLASQYQLYINNNEDGVSNFNQV